MYGIDVCPKSTGDVLTVEREGKDRQVKRGNIDHEVGIREGHAVAVDNDIKDLVAVSATGLGVEMVVIHTFVEEATERGGHIAGRGGGHVAGIRGGHVAERRGHVAGRRGGPLAGRKGSHVAVKREGHVAGKRGGHIAGKRGGHVAGRKSLMLAKEVLFK